MIAKSEFLHSGIVLYGFFLVLGIGTSAISSGLPILAIGLAQIIIGHAILFSTVYVYRRYDK